MKKLYFLKTMLLLCALVVGSASVWAADYTTLPFNWDGGGKSSLTGLDGVTVSGLGSDYASGNSPYLVKLDDTGDYIQIKTDKQPEKVTIKVKMIGGENTSKITIQGSSDGTTFTDIEELSISGKQSSVHTLETTKDFATTDRFVKLVFTKGSNVGVGGISIAGVSSPLVSIDVSGTPEVFHYGDSFNSNGITVIATHEDTSTSDVTDLAVFSGYGSTTVGNQEITVSYTTGETTKTDTYTIHLYDYTGLEISGTYPIEFWTNDVFSSTGLTTKAVFGDGEKRDITPEVSSPDMTSAGIKTVTVSYAISGKERSTTYDITVSDKPQYTYVWMVNGVKNKTAKITMGESVTGDFPSDPIEISGKKFIGWVTTPTVASDYSGTFVEKATAVATANTTYYAVFATVSGNSSTCYLSGSEITENFPAMAYADAEKSFNDTDEGITWYAKGSRAVANPWIQIRDGNGSYIKVSAPDYISSVTLSISNASNSSGGVNDISKHGNYNGTIYLESSYQNSPSGALGSTTINDKEATIDISSKASTLYIQTSGSARIWNIEVTCGNISVSAYTTTPSAVGTTVTIGETGYATFVHPYDVKIPTGVEAFVIIEEPTTTAKLVSVTENIPANCPVILKATADDYDFDVADTDVDAIVGNKLQVSDATTGNGIFVLAKRNNVVGFYKWNGGYIGAGRVYLPASAGAREFIGFDDETAGISSMHNSQCIMHNEVYDLQGRRVESSIFNSQSLILKKGLYIVNGKKVIK